MHHVVRPIVDTPGSRRLAFWLLAACAAWGCSHHEPAAEGPAPLNVQLVQPQVRTIVRVVEQPSFVESYERSSVFPKMTAYIEKWNVDIGDRVKKGEVLASLFVPELVAEWNTKKATVTLDQQRVDLAKEVVEVADADVKAAQARLEETQAILAQYQSEVDRWDSEVKRLAREVAGGVVDPQVLLESKNQAKSSAASRDAAKATIAKAQAELLSKMASKAQDQIAVQVAAADLAVAQSEARRLQALVGYLVLPAPFDGVITGRNANTFDFVLPASGDPSAMGKSPYLSPGGGGAPIYVVERTDVIRVFVDIPESDANYVRPGTKATVLIQAFDDEPISAAVTRTAWALNVKSRTLRAEIDLPNTDSKIPADVPMAIQKALAQVHLPRTDSQILPGMYAYGNVLIKRPDVWTLPHSSLDYSNGKTFYWTCEKNRARRIEVRIGVSDGTWTEVTGRRPLGHANHSWTAIDGSEHVIASDDLAALTEGALLQPTAATGKEPSPKITHND